MLIIFGSFKYLISFLTNSIPILHESCIKFQGTRRHVNNVRKIKIALHTKYDSYKEKTISMYSK